MPLTAGSVNLPPDLAGVFSGIGTNAYNKIGQNYATAGTKPTFDPSLGGSGITDYQRQRLAATQGLDIGNLASGLGGELGGTAYNNALEQRGFEQSKRLAEEVASYNRPDLLQEIMMGIGSVGKPLATYYGLKGLGGNRGGYPSVASYPSSDILDLG